MKEIYNDCKIFIKKNVLWIIALILTICFFMIIEDVLDKDIMKQDVYVYNFLSRHVINEEFTPLMKFISNLGSAYVLITVTIIMVLFIKKRKYKIMAGLNLILIFVFNQTLKHIIQRPRPNEFRIVDAGGYSFPSGHSMVSMAVYGMLIYIIFKTVKNRFLRWGSIVFLVVLTGLIGLSRVYLGVHYSSDVQAGFILSLIYLIIFTRIANEYEELKK